MVVIGASAGGLEPLIKLVGALPSDLPAAVFVVVHTGANNPATLPNILSRSGALSAELAKHGDPIRPGRIYVAAPDRHLLISDGMMKLTTGPKENGFRPAVDPLFRTAAAAYGPRVIGVVLSGGLNDGAYGMMVIAREGGVLVVQDPGEALVTAMPSSVIQAVDVEYVLPAEQMGAAIARLAHEPVIHLARESDKMANNDADETRPDVAERGGDLTFDRLPTRAPTGLTCPDCGGALWELGDEKLARYRCHVGHGYTAETLVAEQDTALENALWAALRSLEESAELSRHMLARAEAGNMQGLAQAYLQRERLAEHRADLIRAVLLNKGERQSA